MSDGVSINTNPKVVAGEQINPHVLMEILSANEAVADRIKNFQQAKADAEKALAALKLGKDTKKAYEDADVKYNQAVALRDKAQKDSDSAIRTVAEAQASAQGLLSSAQAQHDTTMAKIAKSLEEHEIFVANSKAELEAKQRQLDAALDSVDKDKSRTLAAQKVAALAHEEAKKLQELALAAEQEFKVKAEKLHQALAQIAK